MKEFLRLLRKIFFNNSGKLEFISRAEYLYHRGNKEEYFINCEHLVGKPDIVIYRNDIYEIGKGKEKLSEELMCKIAIEVKNELEAQGLIVEMHPVIFCSTL